MGLHVHWGKMGKLGNWFLPGSPLPFGARTSRLNFGNLTRGSEGIKKEQTTDVYKKAGDKWAVSVLMGSSNYSATWDLSVPIMYSIRVGVSWSQLVSVGKGISGCKHPGGGSYSCWVLHTLVNH